MQVRQSRRPWTDLSELSPAEPMWGKVRGHSLARAWLHRASAGHQAPCPATRGERIPDGPDQIVAQKWLTGWTGVCTRGDRIANARREKAPPPVLTPAGLGLAGPHSSPPGGPANPPCVPRQMSLNIKAARIHLGPSARLPSLVLWGGGSRPSVEQLRGVRGPARGRHLPLPREAVKPPAPFRGAGTK